MNYFFLPERKSYRDYHIGLERRRNAGEKIGRSHARANVVVCCLLFYKIYITPRAYRRVFAGNCFQHFPLLLFCSQFPFFRFRSNTYLHTHCHLSCLPFTSLFWNNLFWSLRKKVVFRYRHPRPRYYALCCLSTTHEGLCSTVNIGYVQREWHTSGAVQGTADFFPSADSILPKIIFFF